VVGGLLLVALIALLDYGTGPNLSFGIFYLIPVAACAWWGGFAPATLVTLAGALAWHAVDGLENPLITVTAAVWNGVARFGTLVLTSSLVSRLHAGILRERRLARTDPLTGAANGRTFYEAAAAEAERARRLSRPLTLAYLDLDNFKQLNDRLGHAAGDAALLHVVHSIHLIIRASDLLARLGGDEFALLLPETEAAGAAALLARLQESLGQEMARRGWPVTLSVGAITFRRPHLEVDLMIRRVDALMYRAKSRGKGRVEHAVVHDTEDGPGPDERGRIDRRATARVLCNRTTRVRPEGQEGEGEEFATIRDISPGGIGLCLSQRFERDTVLIVQPLCPGGRALLARVVRVAQEGAIWVHGCRLSARMPEEEIRGWLGAPHEEAPGPLPALCPSGKPG
jgi:diguanylate cyclase (GGDEF)-like protein